MITFRGLWVRTGPLHRPTLLNGGSVVQLKLINHEIFAYDMRKACVFGCNQIWITEHVSEIKGDSLWPFTAARITYPYQSPSVMGRGWTKWISNCMGNPFSAQGGGISFPCCRCAFPDWFCSSISRAVSQTQTISDKRCHLLLHDLFSRSRPKLKPCFREKHIIQEEKQSYRVHLKLMVKRFNSADVGTYMCVSTNSLGRADGTIRLYGEIFPRYVLNFH